MADALISAFDIIGPSIIGPSSSHTAGAARLALWARRIAAEPIASVRFVLLGSFAETYKGHGTDRALLAGLLGYAMDDPAIRDAYALAKRAGLAYRFEADGETIPEHPNTVRFYLRTKTGRTLTMEGQSLGGAQSRISALNGIRLNFQGTLNAVLISHRDRPGILALITQLLAEAEINIASLSNYRHQRGRDAYTLVETDNLIEASICDALTRGRNIDSVVLLRNEPGFSPETLEGGTAVFGSGKDAGTPDYLFRSAGEALELCRRYNMNPAELMTARECQLSGRPAKEGVHAKLAACWEDMKASVREPLADPRPSMGGLIGGEARRILAHYAAGHDRGASERHIKAIAYAMAVSEQNASMGRIVAAPTAGAAGVIPGVFLAYQETRPGVSDEDVQEALMVAACIGYLLNLTSSLSGAQGGCQAEVGSAAAMAAAGLVHLEGGGPEACFEAASYALANLLGLVCDPIGGLVEAPCQSRNAGGASAALAACALATAGLKHVLPFDEMLEVHRRVGASLPQSLRETARGGMAAAPSALARCRGCSAG